MESKPENVIETRGLGKVYPVRGRKAGAGTATRALQGLNLAVPRNSIFGFLGPNGAGKTTTIKLLLGLARPTSGSGTVFGYDIVNRSTEIRERTGYMAQDMRYYEHMTARETLRFVAGFFYKGPRDEIEARAEEMLKLTGLEGKADRPVGGFSGGERQRLGIAQAQINYPDLLILDEPAASLDPEGRRDVLELMERLRRYTTIFYSTHLLDDVQRVSDTVAILNEGQLVAQAPIQDLLAGGEGTVYQVSFKGDPAAIQPLVTGQPWVSGLHAEAHDGGTRWQVSVSDADRAENELLPLITSDRAIRVAEFGVLRHRLEDIFLDIVEGGNRGNG
jgi:ABC-2 type transport system ATP-binding protein